MEELYDTTDVSNPWWKYPVTGDENKTDLFGGASAAYNRGAPALAALRSTVGDAKFREIEKTWVQEHQEQFDPTGLKITATYSDKSTKPSTQPNGVSNPLSKTGASTAPIIALAALALLTGGAAVAKRHSEPEPQHRR